MTQIDQNACRKAFEEWSMKQGWDIEGYPDARQRWVVWQAAWNTHSALPPAIPSVERHVAERRMELSTGQITHERIEYLPIPFDAMQVADKTGALADRVRELKAENERLRKAIGNISRMRTMPDHKSNTFMLVAARMLADQALNPNSEEGA